MLVVFWCEIEFEITHTITFENGHIRKIWVCLYCSCETNNNKEFYHPINNTAHEFCDIFIKIQILFALLGRFARLHMIIKLNPSPYIRISYLEKSFQWSLVSIWYQKLQYRLSRTFYVQSMSYAAITFLEKLFQKGWILIWFCKSPTHKMY